GRAIRKSKVMVQVGPNAYDLAASVRAYCDDLRLAAKGRGSERAANMAARERARLLKAQADAVQLKNEAARGALLDSDAVQREWSRILGAVRSRMLAVPSRAAQRLPHLTAHDIGEVDREIRDALSELGDQL